MKFVVGYDRDLARVCLRRNLMQVIRPGVSTAHRITEEEVEYFSERLTETAVFGYDEKFGTPWVMRDESVELIRVSNKKVTRAQLQRCEMVANNLLIYEGVIGRSGAILSMNSEQGDVLKRKIRICAFLFQKSSIGDFRTPTEKQVLQKMSQHVFDWIRCLSFLPGNDFMDMLSDTSFQ